MRISFLSALSHEIMGRSSRGCEEILALSFLFWDSLPEFWPVYELREARIIYLRLSLS